MQFSGRCDKTQLRFRGDKKRIPFYFSFVEPQAIGHDGNTAKGPGQSDHSVFPYKIDSFFIYAPFS
jgi:hypothetical protein